MASQWYLSIVPDIETKPGVVTLHRRGTVVAIIASGEWTPEQFDAAVPVGLRFSRPGDWDYRTIDGHDVWTLDTATLNKDGE